MFVVQSMHVHVGHREVLIRKCKTESRNFSYLPGYQGVAGRDKQLHSRDGREAQAAERRHAPRAGVSDG